MSAKTAAKCAVGIPGCDCDSISDDVCDLLDIPRGSFNELCECHDCYGCGEISCTNPDCTDHDDA